MICNKCGAEMSEGSRFCTNCGQEFVYENNVGTNSKNNENNFPYLDIVYDSIGEEIAAHPMRAAFDLSFSLFKNREFYRLLSSSAVCYADETEKA